MSTEPDRRRIILDAALEVFAAEGVQGASIKAIARAARLKSPSLIYWYFKDKDELARAVITELSPVVRQAADPAGLMDRPPREVLREVMTSYYATLDHPQGVRLMRLLFTEAVRAPELAAQYSGGQIGVLRFMVNYLRRQTALGRLRPHDPGASARAFLGAMFGYVLTRDILPYFAEGLPERERYIDETVATFVRGLEADRPQVGEPQVEGRRG